MVAPTRTRAKAKTTTRTRATTRARTNGHVTVKVASLPGVAKEVVLQASGATVAEAIRAFGGNAGPGQDVRVNNRPVSDLDEKLKEGSIVTIVGQVNGG